MEHFAFVLIMEFLIVTKSDMFPLPKINDLLDQILHHLGSCIRILEDQSTHQ